MSEEKRITIREAAKRTGKKIEVIQKWVKREKISHTHDLGGERGLQMVLLSEVEREATKTNTRKPINFRISDGTRQRLTAIAKIEGLAHMRESVELITARAWDAWYAPKEKNDEQG